MLNATVKAFAPVNIAWIKYMGKDGGRPANGSLSHTLHSFGTTTSISLEATGEYLTFAWNPAGYVPPESGRRKAENFLKKEAQWKELLTTFGFQTHWPKTQVKILTENNVPAGTGIATSASAFAALTLAWSALLAGDRKLEWMKKFNSGDAAFREALAAVASLGSGSAARSMDGPWVEWSPAVDQIGGIKKIEGGPTQWVDLILVIESAPKAVSSSEAHERVKTSPLYEGRAARVEARLIELKTLLKQTPGTIPQIQKLVLEEALDMHELFHTSQPPFRYMQALSQEVVSLFRERSSELPTKHGVITLDAGANVHLFVPCEELSQWSVWVSKRFPTLKVLIDHDSDRKGAHYEIF